MERESGGKRPQPSTCRFRRDLLLTCLELLAPGDSPLLTSLVHSQLAHSYTILGVDQRAVESLHAVSNHRGDGTVALRDQERYSAPHSSWK